MCIFYLIDAYKAKKIDNIPAALREAVGASIKSVKVVKEYLFPRHFNVQDAMDAIKDLADRMGI